MLIVAAVLSSLTTIGVFVFLRWADVSRRYLLTKISDEGYSISTHLREKQMSMLDAIDEKALKKKRERQARKPKEPAPPKEEKPKTWEVSYTLYQKGMNPADIAAYRSLAMSTIMGHLARYVPSGKVLLDDLISADHQQAIRKVIRMIGDGEESQAIKSLCPPDVTYDEIRLMLEVMKAK